MNLLYTILIVKAIVCQAAAGLVFAVRRVQRYESGPGYRWVAVLLVILAAVSAVSYFDFGHYPKHGSFLNPHDFYHYYLGSKYWREVGYRDIYRATVVADAENHGGLRHRRMRSQDTYAMESPAAVMRNADAYRGRFTPERWETFKRDVAHIEGITKSSRWLGVVRDKGYNATPVWNMVASFLTNRLAPLERPHSLTWLMALDLLLAVLAAAMVYRAFGFYAGTLYVIYFTAHFAMSYPHIRGAFLRLDWVSCLVMAACCLKLGRHGLAGGLAAYAAAARIFPLVFAFGMGARLLRGLWRWHRGAEPFNTRHVRFFVVFTLVGAALLGGSILHDGGLDHWKDFLDKITMHNEDLSPSRVGFKYVFLNAWSQDTPTWGAFETREQQQFNEAKPLWRAILAAVIALVFAVAWRVEDHETVPLGYVLAYFLTAPTFYYHVMLVVLFLLFIGRLRSRWHAVGAALMFTLCAAWYAVEAPFGPGATEMTLSFVISWTLLGLVAYSMVAAVAARREESGTTGKG